MSYHMNLEEFERLLLRVDSPSLGRFAIALSQILGKNSRPTPYQRRLLDLSQPTNPLQADSGSAPAIEIVTVTAADTFQFAEISLQAALSSSQNPVAGVYAIVPHNLRVEATRRIPSAEIISEREVLPNKILRALDRYQLSGRRHWVLCQVLGMYFARSSSSPGTLIVDADTFILGERLWLDHAGRQSLSLSLEYHQPYEDHCKRLYGPRRRFHGLSFITHYMLMQSSILKRIFTDDHAVEEWILAGDTAELSAVGDYHTYGRWLVDNMPGKVAITRWRNKPLVWDLPKGTRPGEAIETLRARFPGFHSVSSHRWMENRRPS